MKLNWGHKLTIFIAIFIIAMLAMVGIAMKQTNEMIDKDYYSKELKYQDNIDGNNRFNQNFNDSTILFSNKKIVLNFSDSVINDIKDLKFEMLSMANSKNDYILPNMTLKTNDINEIDLSSKNSGNYKVRIQFSLNNEFYYKEFEISL